MAAPKFIDTNILIYSVDKRDKIKNERALSVLRELLEENSGVISTQSLQEFYSAATRKIKIPPLVVKGMVSRFQHYDVMQVTPDLINQAIDMIDDQRTIFPLF